MANLINIQGFNKLTLLDYPGKVACTVFTGGCDLRCPFCHNSQLVLHPAFSPIDEEEVFSLLRRRKGILDGVAITGGEPLLHPGIADFISEIRKIGDFGIKLDTNGTHPDRLRALIDAGLVDYVAMDIKNSQEKYGVTVGIPDLDVTPILASVALLMEGKVPYEFRTTAVAEFHDEDSFVGIGKWIRGAEKYFIQNFVDSGALLCPDTHGFDEDEMKRFREIVKPYVPAVALRGV